MYQRGGKSKVTGAKVADMNAAGRFTSYSINRTNLRIRSESSDFDGPFSGKLMVEMTHQLTLLVRRLTALSMSDA